MFVSHSQFEELLRRAGLDGLGTESSEEILRAVRYTNWYTVGLIIGTRLIR